MLKDSTNRLGIIWGRAALVFALVVAIAACQPRPGAADPVVSAVRDNDARRIGQYLAEGGDPNRLSSTGDPLLYVATGSRGGVEVMRELLIGGANTQLTNSTGRTALHNAAGWCHAQMVLDLIDMGADPTAVDNEGKTPLDSVCSGPLDAREEVIALLSASGG